MVNFTYDPDGNMTWNDRKALSYDAENRLLSAAPSYWGTTNGATRTDYTYDYLNRRVSKTTSVMSGRSISYPPSPLDPQGSWSALETRKYIYDGWNLIAEIIIDQTEFTTNANYYAWGLDLSGTLQGAGGVGGLLATTVSTPSTDSTYLTLSDANGNITEYVDDTGAVTAHYEYNAFGETTYKSGTMKDDFAFRFSSKYFDKETGFYYYGHRYYDPVFGRWISTDSIEEADGPGIHLFLENDGVNEIDLLGLRGGDGSSTKCCYCGPEVSNGLVATLNAVEAKYKSLIGSNPKQAIDICKANYLSGTWDILFPGSPSGCGDGKPCNETYSVKGKCYNKWDINYILFGRISSLCEFNRLKMELAMKDIVKLLALRGLNRFLITTVIGVIVMVNGCSDHDQMKENVQKAGGAACILGACNDIRTQLLRKEYLKDIPIDSCLNHLDPQFISLININGVDFYNIQTSGGFHHAGYLVTAKPNHGEDLPFPNWKKKCLGDGIFIYKE